MKKILIIVLCACSFNVFSQNRIMNFVEKLGRADENTSAKVNVSFDRVSKNAIVAFHDSPTISGYKINIFSDKSQSGRDAGNVVLANFKDKFPGIPYSQEYILPDFKIEVGGYLSRSEANIALGIIKPHFPKAFIVPSSLPISFLVNHKSLQTDASSMAE